MRNRAFVTTALCLALAGCGGASDETALTVLEKEARRAEQVAAMDDWQRLFAAPERTIAYANQFGYNARPYAAIDGGAGFGSTGIDSPLSDTGAEAPNSTGFAASGAQADQIDQLRFTLAITDPGDAAVAKQRFADIVAGFLSYYGYEDAAAVRRNIAAEASARDELGQAVLAYDKEPIAGEAVEARRLIVTISRNGATAPATQEPEAQGTEDGNRR
ncbi:DUF6030 family protein [Sphingosinithalassobacter sp. CS137]|uniref:DUF6030 family protein n=1 Tax=Sphingosinithalassobacter sp. CS137 TaxID=2762748 RepID=UPI00165D8FBB|nr:DUF6030 family protein [Sphingosinithalassobacter sp. CS137]